MSTLDPDRWRAVSAYLDEALTLPASEQAAWLARLFERDPTLAMDLRTLLVEHDELSQEGFLAPAAATSSPDPVCEGQTIGAYTLVSRIGVGGMGAVWLAQRSDGRFERHVAIKIPNIALGREGQQRFKREGTLLGRLAHPNIATLLDAGVTPEGQAYLVLEHVEGDCIDHYCDRLSLDVRGRVRLFLDVLDAISHAHAHLIVHRDLKPSNVLVTDAGQVKLLDFGIAKLMERGDDLGRSSPLTRAGCGPMTPAYAAPEQLTGAPVTTATDVYALGALLRLLLSGQYPVGPGPQSPADLVKAIVDTESRRLSDAMSPGGIGAESPAALAGARGTTPEKLKRLLRGDLETIVGKALKKNPHERYLSVVKLADDLQHWLRHEPITARPDSLSYRAAKFARRNRAAVGLLGLTLAAIGAGSALALVQARTARRQRDFAFEQLSRAEAINDLDRFLLSDAAPSGKPFTVHDLLAQAERILDRQKGQEATRVELLTSIGGQYGSLDEDANARRVLEKAYQRSRRLSEPAVRAKAASAWAGALARSSEPAQAEQLFQEALRELPDEPQFVPARVFCLLHGSAISLGSGKAQEAIDRVEAARQAVQDTPFDSNILAIQISMDLAEAYRGLGRHRDAIAMFEQAATQLTDLGRDQTQTAGTLFNNWALALQMLGRPLEAEPIFRRAIDLSRDDRGEETVSPMLLLNYARALKHLGRLDDAAAYADRAHVKALQAENNVVVNQSLMERARIARLLGDIEKAAALWSEVEPRLRTALPPEHLVFGVIASERALVVQDRGDLQGALRLANQAVAAFETSMQGGGPGADYMPTLLIRRAELEILLAKPDEAVADARRAVEDLQRAAQPGTFSSFIGQAHVALGRALQAQGKEQEASRAFRTASEHLQSALGPDHPESRAARQFARLPPPSR